MKCKEVLKLLKITRQTLNKYKKEGKIKAIQLPNGYFEYDEETGTENWVWLDGEPSEDDYQYMPVSKLEALIATE